jgi:hypothetical protein
MKKLSIICMTLLAVFAMASCRGPQGPAGHDGNANVASSTVTIHNYDWVWLEEYGQWMVTIDYPAITNNVYNHGAVLVYMDVNGAWSQVPLTYYYQDFITYEDGTQEVIDCEASIEVATLSDGAVRLFWTESDFYGGMRPDTHDFKIVAIEASVYSHRTDVDYSNYEAVKTAFQLAD